MLKPDWPETSGQLVIAFSGGLDSTLLLELASQHYPRQQLLAVHVHHGLSPNANHWAQHCQQQCVRLGLPCQIEFLSPPASMPEGIEAWARTQRYARLAQHLSAGGVLLTGHHQDDQAETLLLQLSRGAGVKGLAAMAAYQVWRQGFLARPLLASSRQQLQAQAEALGLSWIEDDSNQNPAFSRNALRLKLWPLWQQQVPKLAANLSRTAAHCAEAQQLLDELAEQDLRGHQEPGLPLALLQPLSAARQRNLLRYWLTGQQCLPPSQAQLEQIQQLISVRKDNQARVEWGDWQLRVARAAFWLLPRMADQPVGWRVDFDYPPPDGQCWDTPCGELGWHWLLQQGLAPPAPGTQVTLGSRQGGERIRLAARQHSSSLKHLLQQAGIMPWQRERLLLVWYQQQLVAVGGWLDGMESPFRWIAQAADAVPAR